PTASTITALAASLRDGSSSPGELLAQTLAHIDATNTRTHAYLRTTRELAERQADAAARTLRANPESAPSMCGIPVALKDVLCVDGVETTASSRVLGGFTPPYTGTAVQRLFDAGAVCVGKTKCAEFDMGSSNGNAAVGPGGHAWAVKRGPGGGSRG